MLKKLKDLWYEDLQWRVENVLVGLAGYICWSLIYIIYFTSGFKIVVYKEYTWKEQMSWDNK